MNLRPYQSAAIEAFRASGHRRGLVVLPTGCGKTIMGLHLAKRSSNTLWLAHREELLQQARRAARVVMPGTMTGIVKAQRDGWRYPVVFASVQTATRPRRLEKLASRDWDLVVVDEAHHAPADSYKRILDAVGAMSDDGPLVLGLTATPERADNVAIGNVFESIVYQYHLKQAVDDGYLVPPRFERRRIDVDLDKVKTVRGDYAQGQLDEATLSGGIVKAVSRAVTEVASGRQTIVFAISVRQAEMIAEQIPGAEAVSGETTESKRRRVLEDFDAGKIPCVVNCMVLTEGFDSPRCDCIVMARPTQSKSLYIQCVGRGLRIFPGKEDCLIVDMVGVSKKHSMVQAPVIFGLETEDGEGGGSATREGAGVDFWRSRMESQIRGLAGGGRSIHWVKAGGGYAVDVGIGIVMLRPVDDGYHVDCLGMWARPLTESPVDLDLAQGIAEDYIRRANSMRIASGTGWRDLPATQAQIKAMGKMRIPADRKLTRGEASDALTKRAVELRDPATERQIAYLRSMGVAIPKGLTKRKAGAMIGKARGR